jgi:hypothetical protein
MNTTQPNNNNQPTANSVSAPPPAGKKSGKTKLVLIIIIAIVIVALLALGVYWLIAGMGQSSAQATANNFMSAMTTNNATKALSYSQNPNDDTSLFYQSSAVTLKGSYKFKQIANKDGAYYVLYSVDGGGNKTARVKVVKNNNKWLVSDFYYSSGELTTDPASTGTNQVDSRNANEQQPQENVAKCEEIRQKIATAANPQEQQTLEEERITLQCQF